MKTETLALIENIVKLSHLLVQHGRLGGAIDVAASLITISKDVNAAYESETGQPINPDLIQPLRTIGIDELPHIQNEQVINQDIETEDIPVAPSIEPPAEPGNDETTEDNAATETP